MNSPYYIVAPQYTEKSAGTKVLHVLAHELNMAGQRAYIFHLNSSDQGGQEYCSKYLAPKLTDEARNYYLAHGVEPIIVYPDIISGNPLAAKKFVHYLLAYPGMNGGDSDFSGRTNVWGFTSKIARKAGTDKVLFLPFWDKKIFYPPSGVFLRQGGCFYAWKHQTLYGRPLSPVTQGMIEIKREWPLEKIAETLRSCETFYSYDETAVIHSAQMCGCKIELIHSDKFPDMHTSEDFKLPFYLMESKFQEQLHQFINETQAYE